MSRALVVLALFVALLGGGWWTWQAPWRALDQLQAAAKAGDAETVDALVDEDAVAANVEADVKGALSTAFQLPEMKDSAAKKVGAAATGSLLQKLVGEAATSAGMARLLAPEGATAHGEYLGLNSFEATVRPAAAGPVFRLELGRRGLGWQVVAIRLGERKAG